MSLLDPSIEHYVLHEKTWKFGGGEIYNTQGEKIGVMKRKLISMRAEIKLMNPDESEICTINKKLVSARPIYDVKTPDGELIGRGKRPMVALRGSIDMYDSDDKMIYKAQGGVTKWNFVITAADDKRKVYAEIKKSDKWRDVFAPAFNFKDRYVIHILDQNAPRLMLLAYAVIIDNVYHDK
ncbi:hypothetical protein EU527_00070 [Candidatus Thorarchaeota archaeon]|nr:MAG: hypothetical protein EU527_00070 [Candidatus Thorarchaeota archaeon]